VLPNAETARRAIVLKFGSSVLTNVSALDKAVTEIYRYTRMGVEVVAVVSAFEGETDRLYAEAAQFGGKPDSRHTPRLVITGEEQAAALLAIACDQSGLAARIVSAREISLRAGGAFDDAYPESIDSEALLAIMKGHDVIVVPGFVAIGETGEPMLLGRGGSDLTAVFLAFALGLESVTLVKDVDGVYDKDPAVAKQNAKRYDVLSWEEAKRVGGQLLQPKAIDFAAARQIEIEVSPYNAADGTIVGSESAEPILPLMSNALRVGVAGLGVVGEGVALRLLKDVGKYELSGVLVNNLGKHRNPLIDTSIIVDNVDDFLSQKFDVVIDALSCGDTGRDLTKKALAQGIFVVSANKQAVAGNLNRLHELAANNGVRLLYGASVGGGTPMVESVARTNRSGEVLEIEAIVNGTVNFILSKMGEGEGFDAAVAAAQEAGFAEADPSADLSGADAKAKASILCFEAWGEEPTEGAFSIMELDQSLGDKLAQAGGIWRQITRINRRDTNVLSIRGSFENVSDHHFFSGVSNEENALLARTVDGGELLCKGRGAGRIPTVESLLADLGAIARKEV